ncbi:MAG: hypothetical protein WBL49_14405, partial [Nitrososphaeraceae archaeon]
MSSSSSSSPTSMTTTIRKGSPSPSPSPLLDRKIDEAAAGLTAAIAKQLHSIGEDNAATIVKYVGAIKSEVNPADHYRRDMIVILCRFSKYNNNTPFK